MKFGKYHYTLVVGLALGLAAACAPKSRFEKPINKTGGPDQPATPEIPLGTQTPEQKGLTAALFGGKQPNALQVVVNEKGIVIDISRLTKDATLNLRLAAERKADEVEIDLKPTAEDEKALKEKGLKISGKVKCEDATCATSKIKLDLNGAAVEVTAYQRDLTVVDVVTVASKDKDAQADLEKLATENKALRLYHAQSKELGIDQDSVILKLDQKNVMIYFRALVGADAKREVQASILTAANADKISVLTEKAAELQREFTEGKTKIEGVEVVQLSIKGGGQVRLAVTEGDAKKVESKIKEIADARKPVEQPKLPTTPSNPSNPSNPSSPSNPQTPSNPSNPSNPSSPSSPSSPPVVDAAAKKSAPQASTLSRGNSVIDDME